MASVVGIDLGTSTSEIAYEDPISRRATLVKPREEPSPIVPSAVWFSANRGQAVVGRSAYDMRVPMADEVVLNIKREMGNLDYPPRQFLGKSYGPPEIAAEILRYLRDAAEKHLEDTVRQAVITVPAKFEALARQHTQKAADLAGLEVLKLLPEPVAALVGYLGMERRRDYLAMVYDFGGGTFDCTVVHAQGSKFQVLSKAGERQMGGAHIDELIAEQILGPKVREAGYEFYWPGRADPSAAGNEWARRNGQELLNWAEEAKKSLADPDRHSAIVSLSRLEMPGKARGPVRVEIHQREVQELIEPLLQAANEQMLMALDGADRTREELDFVLLVGGSTRLPAIRDAVRRFMGETAFREADDSKRKVLADGDPDLLVARGAALVAAAHGKQGRSIEVVDILLNRVGYREAGGNRFLPLFAKGTDIRSAQRDLTFPWARGDTMSLSLYEGDGERCTDPQNKYVGTIQMGPAQLAPGTQAMLHVEYRPDAALPTANAWVASTRAPITTRVIFEKTQMTAAGSVAFDRTRDVDLVFCIDTTGSMRYGSCLEDFRKACTGFAHWLESAGGDLNARLATLCFGDRHAGEREITYSFTPDTRVFLSRLANLEHRDGGDAPESSLDALETACRLPFREGADVRRRVVLVTDAPPAPPESVSLEKILENLAALGITVDVLGPYCQEYDTVVTRTRGRIYNLDEECERFVGDLKRHLSPQGAGTGAK